MESNKNNGDDVTLKRKSFPLREALATISLTIFVISVAIYLTITT